MLLAAASVVTSSLKKAHCFSSPNKAYGMLAALSSIYVISSTIIYETKIIFWGNRVDEIIIDI